MRIEVLPAFQRSGSLAKSLHGGQIVAEAQENAREYRAFLSYSHRDAPIARWLHRRLETYRMPRRLLPTEAGTVPAALTPVFRDREELPAGHDLSEKVRAALGASASLIVICSPASAASTWVGKEIDTFRELHPDRPILAAIVAGDPPSCFHKALYAGGAEPLAADLRRDADGRRLGFLKLVAALSGVGLDSLVQRDAQRRVRRVTAITGVALTAMVAMALLTAVAVTARGDAERQRAEAEGLVEFMLTDLRDNLRAVGRLDSMSAVNGRALRYYGAQSDVLRLSPESLLRRARILQAIGDDFLVMHEPERALTAYKEARQTTQEQVTSESPEPASLLAHTKSLMGIGRGYEELEDWPQAQLHYAAAAKAADRLVRADPSNTDSLMKVAAAAANLAAVQLNGIRDYEGAQRSYERALDVLARALEIKPGDEHILLSQANAFGGLADTFYMRQAWMRSRDLRRKQVAIVERLHQATPRNLDVSFRLAAAYRGLALSLVKTGDMKEAQALLRKARAIADFLSGRDPRNKAWAGLKERLDDDLVNTG